MEVWGEQISIGSELKVRRKGEEQRLGAKVGRKVREQIGKRHLSTASSLVLLQTTVEF